MKKGEHGAQTATALQNALKWACMLLNTAWRQQYSSTENVLDHTNITVNKTLQINGTYYNAVHDTELSEGI